MVHELDESGQGEPVWRDAVAHLKAVDPVLADIIEKVGPIPRINIVHDRFEGLARGIIHQQIRASAAEDLARDLSNRFGGEFPRPGQLLELSQEELKKIVKTERKAEYLRSLATRVLMGDLDLKRLDHLNDEQIAKELSKSKGIKGWTITMFQVFSMARPDVLIEGDVALPRAVQKAYGLPSAPSHKEMSALAEKWRPFRSAAAWYLWKAYASFTPGLRDPTSRVGNQDQENEEGSSTSTKKR